MRPAPVDTFNLAGFLHTFKHCSYHIPADSRTFLFYICNSKFSVNSINRVMHHLCFRTTRTYCRAGSFFKLLVCSFKNGEHKIQVWPWIMFAVMPAFGALFKGFIIPLLIFFYNALKTDIPTDLIPKMITLQKHKQPRHPSVSIAEWMHTEKIQIKRSQRK